MATIRTSIMVHDGMSKALRHMNSAVQSVLTSFEQMHAATSESVDTRQFVSAKKDIALATQALNEFEHAVEQAGNEQDQTNRSLNEGASIAQRLGGVLLGAASAYLSFQGLGALVNFSDEYANNTARIAMMNDSLQSTSELQDMIYNAAQRSFSSYDDMAAMVAKLGNNAASAFTSSAEVVDFAELVQKQFSIAGTSAIDASNATLQLTQALGSGVLRGDELKSIFEQAPNLIQNIADYLDVPIGRIREMAADGEITAQIVKEAMFAAADDINKKFNSMPKTWSNIWTNMVNYAQNKASSLAQRISDFFNSDTVVFFQMAATKAIDVVVMGLNFIVMVLAGLANWVATVGQFFADNWAWIAPILMTIAIVLGSIITILVVKYTLLKLIAVATSIWAARQWLVNAAYLGSPITWVLIAIIAIIALIVYALVVWGEQTATVISFIVGIFTALGVHIYNMIANTANKFLTFAEFLINLFIDPVYAVKKLFYDMVMMVLDNMEAMGLQIDSVANAIGDAFVAGANVAISAINWIVDAINLIPGVNLGKVGKLSKSSGSSIGSEIANWASNIKAPTSDKPVVHLPRLELGNVNDIAGAAAEWAYDGTMAVSDSLNSLIDKAKGYLNYENDSQESPINELLNGMGLGGTDYMSGINDALNGVEDAIKDGNGAAKETAKNTGKLADTAELSKEDLKYLRDQASSKADSKYNNITVKVDMKNSNQINSEMDLDGIVEYLAVKTEEALSTVAEGV